MYPSRIGQTVLSASPAQGPSPFGLTAPQPRLGVKAYARTPFFGTAVRSVARPAASSDLLYERWSAAIERGLPPAVVRSLAAQHNQALIREGRPTVNLDVVATLLQRARELLLQGDARPSSIDPNVADALASQLETHRYPTEAALLRQLAVRVRGPVRAASLGIRPDVRIAGYGAIGQDALPAPMGQDELPALPPPWLQDVMIIVRSLSPEAKEALGRLTQGLRARIPPIAQRILWSRFERSARAHGVTDDQIAQILALVQAPPMTAPAQIGQDSTPLPSPQATKTNPSLLISQPLLLRLQVAAQRALPAAVLTSLYRQYQLQVAREGGRPLTYEAALRGVVMVPRVGPILLRGARTASPPGGAALYPPLALRTPLRAVVQADPGLNVKTLPNSAIEGFEKVFNGSVVTVLQRGIPSAFPGLLREWWKIRTALGSTGYVAAVGPRGESYLQILPS